MTDKQESAVETPQERTARLNFFTESVRAGMHSAGVDIMKLMMEGEVQDASSCMLAGACQFVAELYEQTAHKVGADKSKMREHMLNSIGLYFDTYAEMSAKEAIGENLAGKQ